MNLAIRAVNAEFKFLRSRFRGKAIYVVGAILDPDRAYNCPLKIS
jgi:hypothetical protein